MEPPRCAASRRLSVSADSFKLTLAAGTTLAYIHREKKNKHGNTSFAALIREGEGLIFSSHSRISSNDR